MKESRATTYGISRWTAERARTLGRVIGLAGVGLAMACGGSDSSSTAPPPPATPAAVGNYAITTVNAKPVPVAVIDSTNYKIEVVSGTLSLTSDGKFSVITTTRQTVVANVETFVDSTGGTWTLSGSTVTFINGQDGSTDTATFANSQLTFVEVDGKVTTTFVYAKK